MSEEPEPAVAEARRAEDSGVGKFAVFLDTNPIKSDTPNEVFSLPAKRLITANRDPLAITYLLPRVVRDERMYRMLEAANALVRGALVVGRLVGQEPALTKESAEGHVARNVERSMREAGVVDVTLEVEAVDWPALIHDAVFRRAPFVPGEHEDGFRDRLVLETVRQHARRLREEDRNVTVLLVTADKMLIEAMAADLADVRVVRTLSELGELFDVASGKIQQELLDKYKPLAARIFFEDSERRVGFYYTGNVAEEIGRKFAEVLRALPPGTSARRRAGTLIGPTSPKDRKGDQFFWSTDVSFRSEVFRDSDEVQLVSGDLAQPGPMLVGDALRISATTAAPAGSSGAATVTESGGSTGRPAPSTVTIDQVLETLVRTRAGLVADEFEVRWSTKLRDGNLEPVKEFELEHVQSRTEGL